MIHPKHLSFWLASMLLPLSQLPAQMGGGDPREEIKEIATSIDKQLKEIDDLLRESGRQGQTRNKPKELLEQAAENSLTVQDGIEKLIEKLNDMKNQSGSGSGEPSPDQKDGQGKPQDGQPQDGQPQPGQGSQQRRENDNPDFVQQPQEGQDGKPKGEGEQKPGGEQPQSKPGEGDPKGGQQGTDGGENRVGKRPPNDPTGPGQPGQGEGDWGGLQPYLNFLRNRGASPKVPEKYRKYYEAYLKNKAKEKK